MEKQQGSCGSAAIEPSLSDRIRKPKTEKIRRPPNAFMLFAKDHRRNVADCHPDISNKVVSSMLGQIWKDAPNEIKIEYFNKARVLDELHKIQYPGYVYSPREARLQKMTRKRKKDAMETADLRTVLKDEKHEEKVNDESWKMDTSNDSVYSSEYIPNNPEYFIPESAEMSVEGDSDQLPPDQFLPNFALHQARAGEMPINMDRPIFPKETNSGEPTAPNIWNYVPDKLESRSQCSHLPRKHRMSPRFSGHYQYPPPSFCNSSANFSGPMGSVYYGPPFYPSSMPQLCGPPFHAFWDPSPSNPHSFQSRESIHENTEPFSYAAPYPAFASTAPNFYRPSFGYFDRLPTPHGRGFYPHENWHHLQQAKKEFGSGNAELHPCRSHATVENSFPRKEESSTARIILRREEQKEGYPSCIVKLEPMTQEVPTSCSSTGGDATVNRLQYQHGWFNQAYSVGSPTARNPEDERKDIKQDDMGDEYLANFPTSMENVKSENLSTDDKNVSQNY